MGDIAHHRAMLDAEKAKRGEFPSIRRDLADSFLQILAGTLEMLVPDTTTPPDGEES